MREGIDVETNRQTQSPRAQPLFALVGARRVTQAPQNPACSSTLSTLGRDAV